MKVDSLFYDPPQLPTSQGAGAEPDTPFASILNQLAPAPQSQAPTPIESLYLTVSYDMLLAEAEETAEKQLLDVQTEEAEIAQLESEEQRAKSEAEAEEAALEEANMLDEEEILTTQEALDEEELEEQRKADAADESLDQNSETFSDTLSDTPLPELPDPNDLPSDLTEQRQGEEMADGLVDAQRDAQDLADDLSELPFLPPREFRQDSDEHEANGGTQRGWLQQLEELNEERPMNFQEVEQLISTLLNADRYLPATLRELLQQVLQELLQGHRLTLDQHRLVRYELSDWLLLAELLPPRFFSGLIRPLLNHPDHAKNQLEQAYPLFQSVLRQEPLLPEQRQQLWQLTQQACRELPDLYQDWLTGNPLDASPHQLQYLLERLLQRQALLPGAAGGLQQLSLRWIHQPQAWLLFQMAQDCLFQRPLNSEQVNTLAQVLYESCYSTELADPRLKNLLAELLQSHEPTQSEWHQLLQGNSQQILGYLPYYVVAPGVQELLEYLFTHELGPEENVSAWITDN